MSLYRLSHSHEKSLHLSLLTTMRIQVKGGYDSHANKMSDEANTTKLNPFIHNYKKAGLFLLDCLFVFSVLSFFWVKLY